MTTYVALYRGESVADAKMIAVSSDADLVSAVATWLLDESYYSETHEDDPILNSLSGGRARALQMIRDREG